MEHEFLGDVECEGMLASGDASKPSADLQVSQSLLALCGEAIVEETEESLETIPEEDTLSLDVVSRTTFPDEGRVVLRPRASRSNTCLSTCKVTMGLSQIIGLLVCEGCHSVPMTSATVHICKRGHQICGLCYDNYQVIPKCERCGSDVEGRNELLENFLRRLREIHPALFPQEDSSSLDPDMQRKPRGTISKSLQHTSHKPVDCPHLTCFRVVASNGFLAHFEFEHPMVPVGHVYPGPTTEILLPLQCLYNKLRRAVAVVEVYLTNRQAVERMTGQNHRMATFSVRRDAITCVLLSAVACLGDTSFLAVWCACLYEDLPPLAYCLRAHTATGICCYQGAMTSLHHSLDPCHIVKEARCLVLAPGSFKKGCERNDGAIPLHLKFKLTNNHRQHSSKKQPVGQRLQVIECDKRQPELMTITERMEQPAERQPGNKK